MIPPEPRKPDDELPPNWIAFLSAERFARDLAALQQAKAADKFIAYMQHLKENLN